MREEQIALLTADLNRVSVSLAARFQGGGRAAIESPIYFIDLAVFPAEAAGYHFAVCGESSERRLMDATAALVKSQFIEMFGDPVTNLMGREVRPLGKMGDLKMV